MTDGGQFLGGQFVAVLAGQGPEQTLAQVGPGAVGQADRGGADLTKRRRPLTGRQGQVERTACEALEVGPIPVGHPEQFADHQ